MIFYPANRNNYQNDYHSSILAAQTSSEKIFLQPGLLVNNIAYGVKTEEPEMCIRINLPETDKI